MANLHVCFRFDDDYDKELMASTLGNWLSEADKHIPKPYYSATNTDASFANGYILATSGNGYGPDIKWFPTQSLINDYLFERALTWWGLHFPKTPAPPNIWGEYSKWRNREDGFRWTIQEIKSDG